MLHGLCPLPGKARQRRRQPHPPPRIANLREDPRYRLEHVRGREFRSWYPSCRVARESRRAKQKFAADRAHWHHRRRSHRGKVTSGTLSLLPASLAASLIPVFPRLAFALSIADSQQPCPFAVHWVACFQAEFISNSREALCLLATTSFTGSKLPSAQILPRISGWFALKPTGLSTSVPASTLRSVWMARRNGMKSLIPSYLRLTRTKSNSSLSWCPRAN